MKHERNWSLNDPIYERRWTPEQHLRILHGRKVDDPHYTFDLSAKILTDADLSFWQRIEDMRFAERMAAREERKARGQKRLGGMPRRKDLSEVPRGKLLPHVFSGGSPLLKEVLAYLATHSDAYVNMNSFKCWRKTELLKGLSSIFIDLDDPVWLYERTLEEVAAAVVNFCEYVGIPAPSYIMRSGVGLNVVWLHTEVLMHSELVDEVGSTSEDWKTAIDKLFSLFSKRFVPDGQAIDMTRLFRIAGSVNSKSGVLVCPLFVAGSDDKPTVYDFDCLAEMIAEAEAIDPPISPLSTRTQEEIAERKASAAAKRAAARAAEKAAKLAAGIIDPPKKKKANKKADEGQSLFDYAEIDAPEAPMSIDDVEAEQFAKVYAKNRRYGLVLRDIYRLYRIRGGLRSMPGWRDQFLFCLTVCLAQGGYKGKALWKQIHRIIPHTGFDLEEAVSYMKTAVAYADASQKGKEDKRYALLNDVLQKRLGITASEKAQMETVHKKSTKSMSAEEKRDDDRLRKRKSRGQDGIGMARAEAAEKRQAQAQAAEELRQSGLSVRQIAAKLEISKSVVSRLLASQTERKTCQKTAFCAVSSAVPVVTLLRSERERGGIESAAEAAESWYNYEDAEREEELLNASAYFKEPGIIDTWMLGDGVEKLRQEYIRIARASGDLAQDAEELPDIYVDALQMQIAEQQSRLNRFRLTPRLQ